MAYTPECECHVNTMVVVGVRVQLHTLADCTHVNELHTGNVGYCNAALGQLYDIRIEQ